MRGRRQDEPAPEEPEREEGPQTWRRVLQQILLQFREELLLVVVGTIVTIGKAMTVTIQSGQTGLLFSFGRARRELQPGLHLLIPFVQRARKMPTRSRTLDLPSQRVVNHEGFVYHVDANLVYRVVDVRKAMIEIDELEKGMLQMLGLGVQEVLRSTGQEDMRAGEQLDRALATNLARRLTPWGVEVEGAGFPSVSPSPQSLRITQLGQKTRERTSIRGRLIEQGVQRRHALGLVGTREMPRQRAKALQRLEHHRRRLRGLRALLKQGGWTAPEIQKAELALRARISVRGRSRAIGVGR